MKTKKKTVTAAELITIRNNYKSNKDFKVLNDRSFDINGVQGSFEASGSWIEIKMSGDIERDHWSLSDKEDLEFLLYQLSLQELPKWVAYVKEDDAERRLDKYFRTYKKSEKKTRKTRSDKGIKRGSRKEVFCDGQVKCYKDLYEHIGEWLTDKDGVRTWLITKHQSSEDTIVLISKAQWKGDETGWLFQDHDPDVDYPAHRHKQGFNIGWNISGDYSLQEIIGIQQPTHKALKDTHKVRKTRSDKGKKRGSRTRVFWNCTVDDYDKIKEHVGEWIKDYKGREWIISTHPAVPGKFLLKCKEASDPCKELGWDLEEFGYDDDFVTGWGISDKDDWDKILNRGMPKEDSEETVESVPSATTEELLLEILTTLKEIKSKL